MCSRTHVCLVCCSYGWAFLAVATNPAMDNMQQAVAAGYVEAQLTQHRIYQFAINTGLLTPFPADEIKFMEANEAYLDVQTAAEAKSDYWEQVKLMSAQVQAFGSSLATLRGADCLCTAEHRSGTGVQ